MNKIKLFGFILLSLTLSQCAPSKGDDMLDVVEQALQFSKEQSLLMYEVIGDTDGLLPRTTKKDGTLQTAKSNWWTSGFYPGTLWYLYEDSQDAALLDAALDMSKRVYKEQYTTNNHDIGFTIMCSYGNAYRITQCDTILPIINNTAISLMTRFSESVGCTKSWNRWNYPVIIDNMMNLELLTAATRLTGDETFQNAAIRHADVTIANHFRDDYSSYHLVEYDSISGDVVSKRTHQGYSDPSAWSRGQAWGLYGYVMMYRETKELRYLLQAQNIADYLINHPTMPEDCIPYWDFDDPAIPDAYRDASAGAVIASALVELSTLANDVEKGKTYRTFAEKQIRSLASDAYTAKLGENNNFILGHSVGFLANDSEVDVPLTYADYYYVEALVRLKKLLVQGL